jgi:hypothetical protein
LAADGFLSREQMRRISLQTFGGPDGGVLATYDFLIDAFGPLQDKNLETTGMIDTLAPSARWRRIPCRLAKEVVRPREFPTPTQSGRMGRGTSVSGDPNI